jgi:hypothetical protein
MEKAERPDAQKYSRARSGRSTPVQAYIRRLTGGHSAMAYHRTGTNELSILYSSTAETILENRFKNCDFCLPSLWICPSPFAAPTRAAPFGWLEMTSVIKQRSSHEYTAAKKLSLFFPAFRQKIFPKRNLFAGPFAGEFGWELMQWQGFVRSRRPCYEQVHVLTYPGRDYLYEGCRVHCHDIDLRSAGYGYGLLSPDRAREIALKKAAEIGLTNYDIFNTSLLCTRYHKAFWKQEFRLFSEPPVVSTPYDVLFHFRAVRKEGPDHNKNYSPALADELVKRCADKGLMVGCIGHPNYAYCPTGCADYRHVDLRQTVAAISSAHAIAGENSGPMHLANLCGKPTILWAQDQWRIDYSLRWNPFRVPIYVAANNTCQPRPEVICSAIIDALADLHQKSDGFSDRVYTAPAEPIAPY